MSGKSIFNAVNELGENEILAKVPLQLARDGKSYVCPDCGNGSSKGKTGRGSEREGGDGIKPTLYHGRLVWHCYSASHNGNPHMSNVDLIKAYYNVSGDNNEVAKFLEEMFPNLKSNEFPSSKEKKSARTAEASKAESARKNWSGEYAEWRRALSKFLAARDFKWRGLTNETLHEAGAGYNPKYGSIVLPYDEYSFFWRAVEGKERAVNSGGTRRLYYPSPNAHFKAGDGSAANFLTGGEIDALSIKQAMAKDLNVIGVAALGGETNIHSTIAELNKKFGFCADKPRIIYVADNDTAGVNAAKRNVDALIAAGYPAVAVFFAKPTETKEGKVDANSYLQENGDGNLTVKLIDFINDTESELNKRAAEIKKAQIDAAVSHGATILSLSDYLRFVFDSDLSRLKEFSGRKTGFENLDAAQILLPGVYVLGGVPGAGKTTFAYQLLSQLAEFGEQCIFCAYEMTRLELATKSIARELRRRKLAGDEVIAISSADIRRGRCDGRDTDEFKTAREKFEASAANLHILEASNLTIDELLAQLDGFQKLAQSPLTIAVDYLQLIPIKESATAKDRVDQIMLKLKTFQRNTNATLIVISSFNRESNKGVNGNILHAFKESGAIEYSADVAWGLTINDPNTNDDDGNKTPKPKMPRPVWLVCSKNRNGETYNVQFDYWANSDYFCPVDESVSDYTDDRFTR